MMTRRIVVATILVAMSMSAGRAAEKITWDKLRDRYPACSGTGACSALRVKVITRDGREFRARKFYLDKGVMQVELSSATETIPAANISRIEIRQIRHYFHHVWESALIPPLAGEFFACGLEAPCNHPLLGLLAFAITSPAWAYTAGSVPVVLVAEAVSLVKPSQKFEIVP